MPIVVAAAVTAGASIYSASRQAKAAKSAAQASQQATDQTNALNKYIFETQRKDNEPWRVAGAQALARISDPSKVAQNFQASPDYQFRLGQGVNALNQNNAIAGLLKSGKTLKDTVSWGQNIGGAEFGDWWNRQAGLAGVGQTANAANAQAGQFYAGQVGNALSNNAANQASSYYNRANAWSQGIGGAAGAIGWGAMNYGGGFPGGGGQPFGYYPNTFAGR